MEFKNQYNKHKIAIVVVGYNRLNSIRRLLLSLLEANYPTNDIPLVISIDCSGNEELYDYVRGFEWPFGDKYLIIHEEKLGLKKHVFSCGDLTAYFKAVILLEDDIYVSTEFYNYTIATVEKYNNNQNIAGIALYRHEFNEFASYPFTPLNDGSDTYAVQVVITWGQCWTTNMWNGFRNWLSDNKVNFDDFDMPGRIKKWERAWSKYFYAYLLACDKYFISPYISLSTNFGDKGEHSISNNANWQVNLLNGPKEYYLKDFEDMVKYDVYFNNTILYQKLKLTKDVLCIDLYGTNNNANSKRYWLSVQKLPYRIIKQYALNLRRIELNVIKEIEGNNVYLYDTDSKKSSPKKNNLNLFKYYLRSYNKHTMLKYIVSEIFNKLKAIK